MIKKATFTMLALLLVFALATPVFADDGVIAEMEELSPLCGESPAKTHPGIARLSHIFQLDANDVLHWYCQGYGLGAIRLALRAAAVDSELDIQELLDEMEQDIEEKERKADKLFDVGDKEESIYCTDRDMHHPTAWRYAAVYEVDYDTIIDAFCSGYGFGEIKHALNMDPDKFVEFLVKKTEMGGWGNVWLEFGKPAKVHPVFGEEWKNGKPEFAGPPVDKGKPTHAGPPDGKGKPGK
jgi:hypothetical protein